MSVHGADNRTPFICQLSGTLRARSSLYRGLFYSNFVLNVDAHKFGLSYAYFKDTLLILKL